MTTIPLTRKTILENLLAFKRTAMLRTGIELGVFEALADGRSTAAEIAASVGAPARSVQVLLSAMASAGLVSEIGLDTFENVPGAGELLVRGAKGYAGDAAKIAAGYAEWDAMRELTSVVRKGSTLLDTDACAPDFDYWQDFAAHGTFATTPLATAVISAVEERASGRDSLRVLDAGCGHAMIGLAVTRHFPQARLTTLDHPPMLPYAKENAERAGLADRVDYLAGDAFDVPLGGPYDLILLANVLPQYGKTDGARLLRTLSGALADGGTMVIAGFTVGDKPAAAEFGARMLSLLMLAWTTEGQVHTTNAYLDMFAAAGLDEVTAHDVPGLPNRVFLAGRS